MTEGTLVSPPRCGIRLKVDGGSFSNLLPGEYPCTREVGHKPADEHSSVVHWRGSPKPAKKGAKK